MLDNHWSAKAFIISYRLLLIVLFALVVISAYAFTYYSTMEWRGQQEAKYITIVSTAKNTDYITADFYETEQEPKKQEVNE